MHCAALPGQTHPPPPTSDLITRCLPRLEAEVATPGYHLAPVPALKDLGIPYKSSAPWGHNSSFFNPGANAE